MLIQKGIKFDLKRFMNRTSLAITDLEDKYGINHTSLYLYKGAGIISNDLARSLKKDFKLDYDKCLNDTIG